MFNFDPFYGGNTDRNRLPPSTPSFLQNRKKPEGLDMLHDPNPNFMEPLPMFVQPQQKVDFGRMSLTAFLRPDSQVEVPPENPFTLNAKRNQQEVREPVLVKETPQSTPIFPPRTSMLSSGLETSLPNPFESSLPLTKFAPSNELSRLELQFASFGDLMKKSPTGSSPSVINSPMPVVPSHHNKPPPPSNSIVQNRPKTSNTSYFGSSPSPPINNFPSSFPSLNSTPPVQRNTPPTNQSNGYGQRYQQQQSFYMQHLPTPPTPTYHESSYPSTFSKFSKGMDPKPMFHIGDDLLEFNREFQNKKEARKIEYNTRKKKGVPSQPKKKTKTTTPKKKKESEQKEELYIVTENFIFSNTNLDLLIETVERVEYYTEKLKHEFKGRGSIPREKQDELEKIMQDPLIDLTVYEKVLKSNSKGISVSELVHSSTLNLVSETALEKEKRKYQTISESSQDDSIWHLEDDENVPKSTKSESKGKSKSKVVVKPNLARIFNNAYIKNLNSREVEHDLNLVFDYGSRRSQRIALKDEPSENGKKYSTSEEDDDDYASSTRRKRRRRHTSNSEGEEDDDEQDE